MWVVVVEGETRLSDDKDTVEDVGSGLERPKRWNGVVPVPVVGDGKTISSLDEDDERVADSSSRSGRTAVTMALDDFAEKGQIGEAARARPPRTRGGARGSRHGSATYPFDAEVDFK